MFDTIGTSKDVISRIRFAPTGRHIASTSLDGDIRLYDVFADNYLVSSFEADDTPVLDIDWLDTLAVVGLSDGRVCTIDFERNAASDLGDPHSLGVSAVTVVKDHSSLVCCGSWDKSLQFIDTRNDHRPTTLKLGAKVFGLASAQAYVIANMGGNTVQVYDTRRLDVPIVSRHNELKYQARSLSSMPSGEGYALGSVEGRVSVEYITETDSNFCFKCHRKASTDGIDLVDPVNALVFTDNALVSGGGDRYVCIWDTNSKKRIKRYPQFESPVVALDYANLHGRELLAVACSDDDYKNMDGPTDVEHARPVAASRLLFREMSTNETSKK